MKETVIFKKSFYQSTLSNTHLLETVRTFIIGNKEKFTERSWNCNINTSKNKFKNILYEVEEFKYITENIEKEIKTLLKSPFMITDSWINILNENGYQEFHQHVIKGEKFKEGSGVLYFTKENSNIEFAYFPEQITYNIKPEEGDIIIFDSDLYHRVVDSKKERISLAFNFNY
tara:strand:+ start:82 stop:600 length:519 start_codon:yes stop_codon:yes gene_type:complete